MVVVKKDISQGRVLHYTVHVHCKIKGHSSDKCKKIGDSIHFVQSNEEHNYALRAVTYSNDQGLLVDTGPSSHIIRDLSKFTDFCDKFKDDENTIELTNDDSQSQAAKERGTANVNIAAKDGQTCSATLKNGLYVPDYPCDICSVNSAIDNSATILFGPNSANMITHDGRTFDITKKGTLYYLPTKNNDKLCVTKQCTLKELHDTMGHCNVSDLLKLQAVVHGIKIKDPDEKIILQHLLQRKNDTFCN